MPKATTAPLQGETRRRSTKRRWRGLLNRRIPLLRKRKRQGLSTPMPWRSLPSRPPSCRTAWLTTGPSREVLVRRRTTWTSTTRSPMLPALRGRAPSLGLGAAFTMRRTTWQIRCWSRRRHRRRRHRCRPGRRRPRQGHRGNRLRRLRSRPPRHTCVSTRRCRRRPERTTTRSKKCWRRFGGTSMRPSSPTWHSPLVRRKIPARPLHEPPPRLR
mmetsp:Transcript_121593/g.343985  ORF Transcript_121593/g.343985 Transcript_121593/m.343985 type:complete len:214 (+) Transcript_121593:964-1605(+)